MLRLKFERLQRELTLQELGFKARIQASEISKFERKILKPYPAQLVRLARVLKCATEDLLEEMSDDATRDALSVGRVAR